MFGSGEDAHIPAREALGIDIRGMQIQMPRTDWAHQPKQSVRILHSPIWSCNGRAFQNKEQQRYLERAHLSTDDTICAVRDIAQASTTTIPEASWTLDSSVAGSTTMTSTSQLADLVLAEPYVAQQVCLS